MLRLQVVVRVIEVNLVRMKTQTTHLKEKQNLSAIIVKKQAISSKTARKGKSKKKEKN